ncbi:MAG: hypothetical protein EOP92_25910 [Lysobacteraceae bacterium]|nr:MAG: hypothetical protein EOP92_25910 [Xanthomonadaceae bacterium]
MAAKNKTASKAQETTLRHLWLAGLGLVAVARREASTAANDAASRVESLKKQAGKFASDTQANVRGGIASVREQGEATAGKFSAEVEARLAPVLAKLGLKPQAKARKRKPVAKTAAKRTRATAASRPKPATKRTVRKTAR